MTTFKSIGYNPTFDNHTNTVFVKSINLGRIHSPYSGVVSKTRSNDCEGFIEIKHDIDGDIYHSVFCNIDKETVSPGDLVKGGQVIGYTIEKNATAAEPAFIECGDVMLDNALYYSNGLAKEREHSIFLTLHRPSNVDNPEFLLPFLQELVQIASDLQKELHFSIHPRTAHSLENSSFKEEWEQLKLNNNLVLFPPLSYSETLAKLTSASLVWTDSGGLCKEAFYMGTPCLILRSETEWTELVTHGYAKVVHNDLSKIKFESETYLNNGMPASIDLYGNGKAAEIILSSIKAYFA